jgi:hypothetical protein
MPKKQYIAPLFGRAAVRPRPGWQFTPVFPACVLIEHSPKAQRFVQKHKRILDSYVSYGRSQGMVARGSAAARTSSSSAALPTNARLSLSVQHTAVAVSAC